jgi:16S rRNA (cytosine967-C5)-methyltransferase
MNKVSAARAAAFAILLKIDETRAFSSALMPAFEKNLGAKDKSLCHQLTLGVLRTQMLLDRALQIFSKTKIEKLDREVLIALRLGLYQLFYLDKIPSFSAINESVNLVHLAKKRSAAGFANAVLRRASGEKNLRFEYTDEIEKISIETSHPRPLIERWTRAFGLSETENLARANNENAPLAFRLTAKSDERTVENLRKLGAEISPSAIAKNGFTVEKSNEMLFAFANSGKIYFQEEASQLVGETVNLKAGEKFLDVCAAPGSKFNQIRISCDALRIEANQESENRKTKTTFVAGDLHLHRLNFLRQSAGNQGVGDLNLIAYDAEKALPFADNTFDRILLDAPCSGTGTIRHNPEIRYFLEEKDFLELQNKQLEILRRASNALAVGGTLVYSTCSLEREENEAVIEKFLEENERFEKITPRVPQNFLTAKNFARTFPARDGADGFFVAVLEKKC